MKMIQGWVMSLALAVMAGLLAIPAAVAQDEGDTSALEAFRQQVADTFPDSAAGDEDAVAEEGVIDDPTMAVFVRNRTRKAFIDDEVDGIRDSVIARLAGEGVRILDPADVADSFTRYKITTAEEKAGLVDGVFSGGSVTRVAGMIDADYIVTVSISSADVRQREMGGAPVRTYRVSMPVKVLDGVTGASVYGDVITMTYPTQGAGGTEDTVYYSDLFNRAGDRIASTIMDSRDKWRAPSDRDVARVSFTVSTTIDELVNGLEQGARGPNELLDELRRTVGGVTVELDGLALGTSPGTFQAAPGMHQLRLTRQWMEPWQKTVEIREGSNFNVALELSDEGIRKFGSVEAFRAATALIYAEAAYTKGIKINFDTAAWQNAAIGNSGTTIDLDNISQGGLNNRTSE